MMLKLIDPSNRNSQKFKNQLAFNGMLYAESPMSTSQSRSLNATKKQTFKKRNTQQKQKRLSTDQSGNSQSYQQKQQQQYLLQQVQVNQNHTTSSSINDQNQNHSMILSDKLHSQSQLQKSSNQTLQRMPSGTSQQQFESFQNFQQYLAQQYSNDGGAKHLNPYAQAQILHEQKNSINSNLSNNNRRPTSSSNQSQSQNSTQLPELQNSNAKLRNNPPPKEVLMSDQEKTNFGNRCPTGYKKIKILGKGGIAVVWLGQKNGEQVAMKQFPKQGNQCDSSAIVELQISRLIKNAKDTRGQEHIAKLLDSVEDKKDLWLIYELCKGRSLNEQLFEVKGEFYKGERIYKVNHWSLYHSIRNTLPLIKDFVIRMSEALSLFNRLGIVHADLKPDNILIDFDDSIQEIKSLKIIDFGSAFMLSSDGKSLKDQREFAMSTPEYLPPEIQQYLARKFTTQNNYEISDFSQCPFVFDIWSLGSILLEILTGFPIWLSLKSRVKSLDGRHLINYGIFGVQGRDNQKILQKQITVLSNGMANMKKQIKKGFDTTSNLLFDNQEFIDILGSMLDWNPGTRISPEEVLSHKFLGRNKQQLNQVVQLEDE
eukprot:403337002